VARCAGSLVVDSEGRVAFCTAGCHPTGTAEALATHGRFIPALALAARLWADHRFVSALAGGSTAPYPPSDSRADWRRTAGPTAPPTAPWADWSVRS